MMKRSLILPCCALFLGNPWNLGKGSLIVRVEPPCYFEASNKVAADEREVRVLMDEDEFDPATLKPFMDYFFSKYPEPHSLEVYVCTSRSEWALADYEPRDYRYPSGYFYRKGVNELIRYRLPGQDLRTVVIKGTDPANPSRRASETDLFVMDQLDYSKDRSGSRGDSKPVCYFIDRDEVIDNRREIRIFMNPSDFTEPQLRVLLEYLFARYPEPQQLDVRLYADIDQWAGNYPVRAPSELPQEPYPWARFLREGETQTLRYKLPNAELRTVQIPKGTRN